MKRLYFLLLCVCTQIYALAQEGRVRPELDLPQDDVVSNSDDGGIISTVVILVLIVLFCWIKRCIDSSASKKEYVAKKNIQAFHSISDFYKDRKQSNQINWSYDYEFIDTEDVKEGTKCSDVKKVDENVCWAKFEGYQDPLIIKRDDIRKL